MRFSIVVVLILALLGAMLISPPRLFADEMLATKDLPAGQKLVLSRKMVPFNLPTETQKKEMERRDPGMRYMDIKPVRTDEYSLELVIPDHKDPEILWQKIIPQYEKDSPYTIFDFSYRDGVTGECLKQSR